MNPGKTTLFNGSAPAPASLLIPITVKRTISRKTKTLEPMPVEQRMLCALRKVLATMSTKERRFYISNEGVRLNAPISGKGTYEASGRCRLGVAHGNGNNSFLVVDFKLSFRDSADQFGFGDVTVLEDTQVTQLPPDTKFP